MTSEMRAARDAVACLVARRQLPTETTMQRQAALAIMSMPVSWRREVARERDLLALEQMWARRG